MGIEYFSDPPCRDKEAISRSGRAASRTAGTPASRGRQAGEDVLERKGSAQTQFAASLSEGCCPTIGVSLHDESSRCGSAGRSAG